MIRVQGPAKTQQSAPVKKAGRVAPSFTAGAAPDAQTNTAPNVDRAAPTATLSALLSLQSDGGGNAKTLVAAQRTLDLLDALRLRLLDGEAGAADIEALSAASGMRAHAAADPALQNIYDEIALRARVELAKLGR